MKATVAYEKDGYKPVLFLDGKEVNVFYDGLTLSLTPGNQTLVLTFEDRFDYADWQHIPASRREFYVNEDTNVVHLELRVDELSIIVMQGSREGDSDA